MKVYVIERGEYSDRHVIGVVDSEERAKRIVDIMHREEDSRFRMSYSELELNDMDCITEDYLPKYLVIINDDKTFYCEPWDRYENKWWLSWHEKFKEETNVIQEVSRYDGEVMGVIVAAKDENHALKIAQDLYAEYLAKKSGVGL